VFLRILLATALLDGLLIFCLAKKNISKKLVSLGLIQILNLFFGALVFTYHKVFKNYEPANQKIALICGLLLIIFVVCEILSRLFAKNLNVIDEQYQNHEIGMLDVKAMEKYGHSFLTEEHIYKQQLLREAKKYGKIVSYDNDLRHISIRGGMRVTIGFKKTAHRKIVLLGGSTIFNAQVPNEETISSKLQLKLNNLNLDYGVINAGVSGATSINRIDFARAEGLLNHGDIAVLYFGVNDALLKSQLNYRTNSIDLLIYLINVGIQVSQRYFQLLNKIRPLKRPFIHLRTRHYLNRKLIPYILSFEEYCKKVGVSLLVVLQPSLFSEAELENYETHYLENFPSHMRKSLSLANKVLSRELENEKFFVDARRVFQNCNKFVYADWCHTTGIGNQIVSDFMYSEICNRDLLSIS